MLDLPNTSPFLRLLASAALVAARSYVYRWSSSEEDAIVAIQVVDGRSQEPTITSYEFLVSPNFTIAELLDAARSAIATILSAIDEDRLTVFISHSTPNADLSLLAPSCAAAAVLPAEDEAPHFTALHNNFWADRLSAAYVAISLTTNLSTLRVIQVVAEAEEAALLTLSQNNLPSEVTHPCIHHYFEEIARSSPHLPALCFDNPSGSVTLTYRDMDRRCSALTAYLASTHGIGPEIIVPIFFSRGVDMLIAIFAVVSRRWISSSF